MDSDGKVSASYAPPDVLLSRDLHLFPAGTCSNQPPLLSNEEIISPPK